MVGFSRRNIFAAGIPLIAMLLGGTFVLSSPAVNSRKVIKITARRFQYNPSKIVVKKGAPVTLELTSLDRLHGFYIPDLDVRADIVPGRVVRVELTLGEVGEYDFLCDIFCGQGHGEMSGKISVVA